MGWDDFNFSNNDGISQIDQALKAQESFKEEGKQEVKTGHLEDHTANRLTSQAAAHLEVGLEKVEEGTIQPTQSRANKVGEVSKTPLEMVGNQLAEANTTSDSNGKPMISPPPSSIPTPILNQNILKIAEEMGGRVDSQVKEVESEIKEKIEPEITQIDNNNADIAVTQALSVERQAEIAAALKNGWVTLPGRKEGERRIVKYDHSSEDHCVEYQKHGLITKVDGKFALSKEMYEKLHKSKVTIVNSEGVESEFDKNLLREYTREEEDLMANLRKDFAAYCLVTPQPTNNLKTASQMQEKNQNESETFTQIVPADPRGKENKKTSRQEKKPIADQQMEGKKKHEAHETANASYINRVFKKIAEKNDLNDKLALHKNIIQKVVNLWNLQAEILENLKKTDINDLDNLKIVIEKAEYSLYLFVKIRKMLCLLNWKQRLSLTLSLVRDLFLTPQIFMRF